MAEIQKARSWNARLAIRLTAYLAAILLLGWAAERRSYVLTIVFAAVVAIGGIAVHAALSVADKTPQSKRRLHLGLLIGLALAGLALCILVHWRVFSAWGFAGLSLLGFGAGQLAAFIRTAAPVNNVVKWLLVGGTAVALAITVGGGVGGWWLLLIAVALIPPMLASNTEATLDTLEQSSWPHRRMSALAIVGVVLLGSGAALVAPSTGWLVAVLAAYAVFGIVGAISADTDADILFVLVAVAIVWSQFPRETKEPLPTGAGGTIVALGDSYISGEGARRFYAGTNTLTGDNEDQCRRAPTAYPVTVARALNMQLVFLACSGAEAANIDGTGQYLAENPPANRAPKTPTGDDNRMSQLALYDALHRPSAPDWVFISIGGNDAGFGDIVRTCFGPGDCSERGQRWLSALDALRPKLDRVYAELSKRFGDRVVVVPYPIPIRPTGCATLTSTFTDQEHKFLNNFTTQLDLVIEQEAAKNKLRFMNTMKDAFVPVAGYPGGRVCDGPAEQTAVNYFALNPVGGNVDPTQWFHDSMHPNDTGHLRMASRVIDWLGPKRTGQPVESASAIPASDLSLASLMGTDVGSCSSNPAPSSCSESNSDWMFQRTVDSLRRNPGWGVLGLVLGSWMIWVYALAVGRRERAIDTDARAHPLLAVFRAKSRLVRSVGLAVLFGAIGLAMSAVARVVGLPPGYGPAQSNSAATLAARSAVNLRNLRGGTTRDLFPYIPFYVVLGLVVIIAISPAATGAEADRNWKLWQPSALRTWFPLTKITKFSLGLVVAAGVFDYAETVLFRHSLNTLIGGGTAASIRQTTVITRVMTDAKLASLGCAVLLLVFNVILGRRVVDHDLIEVAA